MVDQAFLRGLEWEMAGEGSHEVVYGGKVVLLLYAKDCKLVEDFSLKRVDRFGPVVETPTLLINFVVSFIS